MLPSLFLDTPKPEMLDTTSIVSQIIQNEPLRIVTHLTGESNDVLGILEALSVVGLKGSLLLFCARAEDLAGTLLFVFDDML